MDKIKLLLGDAINELKTIEENSIDLIIADPPYNLSKNYKATNDNMEFDEFINFSRSWLSESKRVLKPGGTIYVFMGMRLISYTHMIMEKELGLEFQNWITWHYTQGLGKKKNFSSRHDDILMFTKPGAEPTFNLDDIRVPQKYYRSINNMRGANPGNVWQFSHVHYSQSSRQPHPTQKPEGVMERMILSSSNENDVVLDPFSGSGTTVFVAKHTNRNGIGIDIEPSFIQETKDRLKEEFNGFDSIDERMLRVPNDLNKEEVRKDYFENHIEWFLKNHEKSVDSYIKEFMSKYDSKMTNDEKEYFFELAKKYNVKLKNKINKKSQDDNSISLF